ncbi:MAG: ARMT1-like domain-containing protein [Desulfosalsimonas sp.]|uniref:damage-control phosphatase ARMT1 family protein n=1 Tax=Desulfosalsimonas sp. TaxID=3073848 RepID=UPI0039706C6C
MKTYFACMPCFLSQALRACRFMGLDDQKTRRVINAVAELIPQIPMDSSPPETGREVYRIIREVSGNADPYQQVKAENTANALALYPVMKQMVAAADNALSAAVRIAAAGNVIDCGVNASYAIEREVDQMLENEFAVFDMDAFLAQLEKTERILYIGDNAGECVFDRVLIEQLPRPVTYVVRQAPIINDATMEDALAAGIDRVADIVSSGTDAPGTVLSTCTSDFLDLLNQPWLKISKGQGNYEALSASPYPVFFLLKAKCSVIARDLDVDEGQMIFARSNRPDFS